MSRGTALRHSFKWYSHVLSAFWAAHQMTQPLRKVLFMMDDPSIMIQTHPQWHASVPKYSRGYSKAVGEPMSTRNSLQKVRSKMRRTRRKLHGKKIKPIWPFWWPQKGKSICIINSTLKGEWIEEISQGIAWKILVPKQTATGTSDCIAVQPARGFVEGATIETLELLGSRTNPPMLEKYGGTSYLFCRAGWAQKTL